MGKRKTTAPIILETPSDLIIDSEKYKLSTDNYIAGNHSKNKIFLISSLMTEEDYFSRLKLIGDDYKEYPHYFISDKGVVYNLFPDTASNNLTRNSKFNKTNITICLENLGWLTEDKDGRFHNWYGVEVNENRVFKRPYREHDMWETYNAWQVNSLKNLIKQLIEKHNIENEMVGHVFGVDEYTNYQGIICRSNINENYTDLSPAFDFKLLL